MEANRDKLGRRSFLTRSTAVLGAIPLFASQDSASQAHAAATKAGNLHLYCDESGVLGNDAVFVLGMLTATDSLRHEAFIARAREKRNFATELSYSSTDRFKRPFAEDLIDYFFREPDLRFSAYVITAESVARLRSQSHSLEQAYHLYYESLIANGAPADLPKTLNLEIRNSIGSDGSLRRHLRENVVNLSRINVVGAPSSNLLQMADLFAGSIYGDAHRDSMRSRVKREILGLLWARLNVKTLLAPSLGDPRAGFQVFLV